MYKIGIDGHMIGDHSGGNESYFSNTLLNMEVPQGCKIYLFLMPNVDDSMYREKFEIIRFRSKNPLKRNFWELSRLSKKLGLNLLHTQYFIPLYRPCKVVCTIHDICFEHFKDIFTTKEYWRQKLLIPYAAKKSEIVFTDSVYSQKDIIEKYNLKSENVVITYCGVNHIFRKMMKEEIDAVELREKFGIGDCDYILSVGNLQPRKNLVRLIEAYIKMESEYKENYKLVIVGKKAWMFDDILKKALEESDNVIFTDYVSSQDLVRLYNEASCFIYPSFFEGFGIPPLEAMACGTPVAVANATSLPEVVGDAGLYFNPFEVDEISNTLYKITHEEELMKDLVNNGYRQYQKFNWNETADIVTKVYLRLKDGQ